MRYIFTSKQWSMGKAHGVHSGVNFPLLFTIANTCKYQHIDLPIFSNAGSFIFFLKIRRRYLKIFFFRILIGVLGGG